MSGAHRDQLELLREIAVDFAEQRRERDRARETVVRGGYAEPPVATRAALEFERLSPELRPIATAAYEVLRGVPRDIALTSLAIVYLRGLPEQRRLELVTLVLEEVLS